MFAPDSKLRAGVLGATGAVGQRFIQLLEDHPWIEVTALGASSRSAGQSYSKATNWRISDKLPLYVADLPVFDCLDYNSFAGLDSSVASEVEELFASNGVAVFSNAKNFRMHPSVPILIPLINPSHLNLVKAQAWYKSSGGFIVTNANCSSTGLAVALKPLHDAFQGIKSYFASTLQAVSGAGYPGLPAIDCIDNIIPYISSEEDKIETEPGKILGVLDEAVMETAIKNSQQGVKFASMLGSAMVHRVPVSDGHTVSVSINFTKFDKSVDIEKAKQVLTAYQPPEDVRKLPSCPRATIIVRDEPDRPQPRLDRNNGSGMSVTVGRVRDCPINHLRLTCLSHNTVLGAAGGSILNAELAIQRGLVKSRK